VHWGYLQENVCTRTLDVDVNVDFVGTRFISWTYLNIVHYSVINNGLPSKVFQGKLHIESMYSDFAPIYFSCELLYGMDLNSDTLCRTYLSM
jgi:hypothetical protein